MRENWNDEGRGQAVDRICRIPDADDVWELFASDAIFPGHGIEWFVDRITSRVEGRP